MPWRIPDPRSRGGRRYRLGPLLALLIGNTLRLPGDGPAIFRLPEHLRRLRDSAKIYRMDIAERLPAIAAAFPPIEGGGSGGDSYTVMARWTRSGGWNVSGGASYLQVIDVGAWDNSVMLNLPGQSNDPRSPHHRDHYDPWIRGEMKPMLFSRTAVDARAAGLAQIQGAKVGGYSDDDSPAKRAGVAPGADPCGPGFAPPGFPARRE